MKGNESEQVQEIFEKLKKRDFVIEQRLNHHIQSILKKEELVKVADIHFEWIDHNLHSLHKYIEAVSTILHVPTQNDVATDAKLVVQGEKEDKLEKHLLHMNRLLKKIIDNVPIGQVGNGKHSTEESLYTENIRGKKRFLLKELFNTKTDDVNLKTLLDRLSEKLKEASANMEVKKKKV
jgi:hypothetical protein